MTGCPRAPPPPVGVGHLWVCGFAKILWWLGPSNHPPPPSPPSVVKKSPGTAAPPLCTPGLGGGTASPPPVRTSAEPKDGLAHPCAHQHTAEGRAPHPCAHRDEGIASTAGAGGGGTPLPPQHSGPDSTPKAFPYPNTSPNRISNRQ